MENEPVIIYPEDKPFINHLGEASTYTTQVLTSPETQMRIAKGQRLRGEPVGEKTMNRLMKAVRASTERKGRRRGFE